MQIKTIIGIILVVIIAGGAIGIAVFSKPATPVAPTGANSSALTPQDTTPTTGTSTTGATTPTPTTPSFSLSDIAQHNSAQSCYTAISGKVYNLTKWIAEHPGGERAILSICGIDGTQAYLGQHGSQRRPAQELAQFLIGTLK